MTEHRAERKGAAPNGGEGDPQVLYRMPGHLIRRCHQISVALFHGECEAFGITPQQYAVLRVLAAHEGIDQITLAGLAAFAVRRVQQRLVEPPDRAERKLFVSFLARIASVNNDLSRAPLRAPSVPDA